MKTKLPLLALTLLLPLRAAPLDADEQRMGFVAIADGRTFAGWKQEGNWEIQDGAFARVRKGGQLIYQGRTVRYDFDPRCVWTFS